MKTPLTELDGSSIKDCPKRPTTSLGAGRLVRNCCFCATRFCQFHHIPIRRVDTRFNFHY